MLMLIRQTAKPLRVFLISSIILVSFVGVVNAQDDLNLGGIFDSLNAEQGATLAILIGLLALAIFVFLRMSGQSSNRKSVEIKLVESLIESNKESTNKSIENLEKSRDELRNEVEELKAEVTSLKQDKASHDKVLTEKDDIIKERDSTITLLRKDIKKLQEENKTIIALRIGLEKSQTRLEVVQKEFDGQKKQWNETFQAMLRREQIARADSSSSELDKTIPIPDTAEIDVIKDEAVTNSANDGTDNNDKKDNAA